ncbi:MAG: GMP/IMP nucleotidase [Pseudomonadota bacterium]
MQKPVVDWSGVNHVLLDMDGTILDLAFDNHFWRTAVPAAYGERRRLTPAQALAELEPHFREIQGTLDWYCLDYWSRHTGLDLAQLKKGMRERIAPLAGAEDFLRAAKASGRPLWLVTNAHPGSWSLKLQQTGFTHWFDRVVCSHDFGFPKEDPRFWQALRAAHPFEPERAFFADDSLPVLKAAREFGVGQIVAMHRPDTTQPVRNISEFRSVATLKELLPILSS